MLPNNTIFNRVTVIIFVFFLSHIMFICFFHQSIEKFNNFIIALCSYLFIFRCDFADLDNAFDFIVICA